MGGGMIEEHTADWRVRHVLSALEGVMLRAASVDLEPCPFCGGPAEMEMETDDLSSPAWMVRCQECYVQTLGHSVFGDNPLIADLEPNPDAISEAAKEWNRRDSSATAAPGAGGNDA